MKRGPVSINAIKHPRYSYRASYLQGSKYQQRYFKTKKDATKFAGKKSVELQNDGRRHSELSDEERAAVLHARRVGSELVEGGIDGFSLSSAVEFYSSHLRQLRQSATVSKVLDELIEIRKAEGKSGWHLRDLQYKARRFADEFNDRMVASITVSEIASWLVGLTCAPQTRLNYRRLLHNLFAFAVSRGYSTANPVRNSLAIKVPATGAIGILTVDEAEALLIHSPASAVPAIAIGLFAGLRREEIAKLDWADIDLERRFIEVRAVNAKSAQRRHVDLSANLKAWLVPVRRDNGPVRQSEALYRDDLRDARKRAGLEKWPHNALRHSFASYHLAMHTDAAYTALQLGHTESSTLFRHYRHLVHADDARKYWEIVPG